MEVTEREVSPDGDFQLGGDQDGESRNSAAHASHVEVAQESGEIGHELERTNSQSVFSLFGHRRESV